jgi:hypothetical protein
MEKNVCPKYTVVSDGHESFLQPGDPDRDKYGNCAFSRLCAEGYIIVSQKSMPGNAGQVNITFEMVKPKQQSPDA